VSYAIQQQLVAPVPGAPPYFVQIPVAYTFTADEGATDTSKPIAITSATVSGNVVTITGSNAFSPSEQAEIGGLSGLTSLIGLTLTVLTASPTQFTASYTHADYGLPNTVSQVQVLSNVLTVETGTAHTYSVGTQVAFSGVGTAAFLNGQTVTVLATPTSTSFTALFFNSDYGPAADSGSISDADTGVGTVALGTPLVSVASPAPASGQYNVTPSGLYTFSAAQAGHTVTVSFRQSFNILETVNSGATQSIVVALAAGRTYYFEVQAVGADGASGQSNIQSITI
jgi:hypothetical protein